VLTIPSFLLKKFSAPSSSAPSPAPSGAQTPIHSDDSREQLPRVQQQDVPMVVNSTLGEERVYTVPAEPATFCMITVDGTIKFLGSSASPWQLQVDHQLFAVANLNASSSKKGDVAICSWDGLTYIVDQDQSVVRFQFPGTVSAFTAGQDLSFPLLVCFFVPLILIVIFFLLLLRRVCDRSWRE